MLAEMHRLLAPLDHRWGRPFIAWLMRDRIRRRHGRSVTVRYLPAEGFWLLEWPETAVPMPEPVSTPPEDFEEEHRDVFFQEYTPGDGDTVVDLGAGIGTGLNLMCRLVGASGHVYAVEADPLTYRCLERRRQLNRLDNAVAIHAAIGAAHGEAVVSQHGSHLVHRVVAEGPGEAVPARTLDELVDTHGLTAVDFLKINVEGAERDVLEGMRASAPVVRNIAVSCHDFLGMPTRAAVGALLTEYGFELTERRAGETREWARSWLYASRS